MMNCMYLFNERAHTPIAGYATPYNNWAVIWPTEDGINESQDWWANTPHDNNVSHAGNNPRTRHAWRATRCRPATLLGKTPGHTSTPCYVSRRGHNKQHIVDGRLKRKRLALPRGPPTQQIRWATTDIGIAGCGCYTSAAQQMHHQKRHRQPCAAVAHRNTHNTTDSPRDCAAETSNSARRRNCNATAQPSVANTPTTTNAYCNTSAKPPTVCDAPDSPPQKNSPYNTHTTWLRTNATLQTNGTVAIQTHEHTHTLAEPSQLLRVPHWELNRFASSTAAHTQLTMAVRVLGGTTHADRAVNHQVLRPCTPTEDEFTHTPGVDRHTYLLAHTNLLTQQSVPILLETLNTPTSKDLLHTQTMRMKKPHQQYGWTRMAR